MSLTYLQWLALCDWVSVERGLALCNWVPVEGGLAFDARVSSKSGSHSFFWSSRHPVARSMIVRLLLPGLAFLSNLHPWIYGLAQDRGFLRFTGSLCCNGFLYFPHGTQLLNGFLGLSGTPLPTYNLY